MEAGTGLRQPWPTRRGQAHTKVPREGLDWGGLSHTGCPEGLSRGLGQLSETSLVPAWSSPLGHQRPSHLTALGWAPHSPVFQKCSRQVLGNHVPKISIFPWHLQQDKPPHTSLSHI